MWYIIVIFVRQLVLDAHILCEPHRVHIILHIYVCLHLSSNYTQLISHTISFHLILHYCTLIHSTLHISAYGSQLLLILFFRQFQFVKMLKLWSGSRMGILQNHRIIVWSQKGVKVLLFHVMFLRKLSDGRIRWRIIRTSILECVYCHVKCVKHLWSSAVLLKLLAFMVVSVTFHVTSVKSLSSIRIPWSCMNGLIGESALFLVMCVKNLLSISVTWSNIYAFMVVNVPTYVKCVGNLSSGSCHWRCIYAHMETALSHVMYVTNPSSNSTTWRVICEFMVVNVPTYVKCVRNLSSGRVHLRTHSGEHSFSCDVCNTSFNQLRYLKQHLRIHGSERPYICEVCKKSFQWQSALKVHLFTHKGECTFSCHVCKKSFRYLNNLKKHVRIHSSERPFSCELCNKSFKWQSVLKVHLRTHSGEHPSSHDVFKKSSQAAESCENAFEHW